MKRLMTAMTVLVLLALVLNSGAAVKKRRARPAASRPKPPATVPALPPPSPFPIGETFVYNLSWKIFDAGTATMTVADRFRYQDEEVLKISATVRSSGLIGTLYSVQDYFESLLAIREFCSRKILKQVNEGWRHREVLVAFDPKNHRALLEDKNLAKPQEPVKQMSTPIPACVQDVISSLYLVRKMDLKVGNRFRLAINDGGRTYDVDVEVQAEEVIKTPAGTYNTFRLEPKVFGGLFKKKGRMFIWYSRDATHIPVQIKARILMGTITASLAKIEKGPALSAPRH